MPQMSGPKTQRRHYLSSPRSGHFVSLVARFAYIEHTRWCSRVLNASRQKESTAAVFLSWQGSCLAGKTPCFPSASKIRLPSTTNTRSQYLRNRGNNCRPFGLSQGTVVPEYHTHIITLWCRRRQGTDCCRCHRYSMLYVPRTYFSATA